VGIRPIKTSYDAANWVEFWPPDVRREFINKDYFYRSLYFIIPTQRNMDLLVRR